MKYISLQDALNIHDIIIQKMQGLGGYNQTNNFAQKWKILLYALPKIR